MTINYIKPFTVLGITLFILTLSSCSSYSFTKPQRACYKELKKFSSEYWKFSNGDSLVIRNEVLEEVALGNHPINFCTQGLTQDQIIQLFGQPHRIKIGPNYTLFSYFIIEGCYPFDSTSYCSYYFFTFNRLSNTCTGFGTGSMTKES